MLVLSRKSTEEIVFPALGITIRVLRTAANSVKLGVDAPSHLKVLRGELSNCDDLIDALSSLKHTVHTHELRNRLNSVVLKLELLNRAEKKGLSQDQLSIVDDATKALASLDADLSQLATPATEAGIRGAKSRLLVVDDDTNERELLTAVLALQGFDVQGVADGAAAIEHLSGCHRLPDAVLLDLQMPRLGGESTLRCIRSDLRLRHLNVIGISGGHPSLDCLPDGQRGFDAWFSKPLQLQQLLDLIAPPARQLCN